MVIDNATITTSITTNVITFTGATYTPTSADVGNYVQMLTGTNVTAGFYEITAQTATTWTVDRNVVTSGTTTNATGRMGGALATLGKLATSMVASNTGFCTGAFTSTATITFTAASVSPDGDAPPTRLVGYGAARTDGTRATLTLATNTGITGLKSANNGFHVANMAVDCASLGTSTGISAGLYANISNCKVSNFTTAGIVTGGNSEVFACEVTGGTSAATQAVSLGYENGCLNCNIHDNACPGIICTGGGGEQVTGNLVTNNTGASSDGIRGVVSARVIGNTVHGNGRDGIQCPDGMLYQGGTVLNNLLTSNGRYGLNNLGTAIGARPYFDGNAYWNNTSGARNGLDSTTGIFGVSAYTNVHDVTMTGSPYVGPTTGSTADFGLNTTAGAGAAARGAGVPASWPGNSVTASHPDMGAVQHPDPAGGSSALLGMGELAGGLQ